MSKNSHSSKPLLTALPPGTILVSINEQPTSDGAISYGTEPAFVLIYEDGRSSVIGLLDHETPLGTAGPPHQRTAYSLLPHISEAEELEGFVGVTYQRLFGPPPAAPEDEAPLLGVVDPPPPSDGQELLADGN